MLSSYQRYGQFVSYTHYLNGARASLSLLLQGDKPPKAEEGPEKTEDLFEDNFKELKNWVEVKSSKFGTLLVRRERRCKRLGTALKVFFFFFPLTLRNLSTLHHA